MPGALAALAARARFARHWWSVFGSLLLSEISGAELPAGAFSDHCEIVTWDPRRRFGDRTVDVACVCGRVFWTRAGYAVDRPWAKP